MWNTEILILRESKISKYYLGTPKLKENGSEYSLLEKIYNALFYSVLEYILQLSMLSHVNTEILILSESKKFKYNLGTPM